MLLLMASAAAQSVRVSVYNYSQITPETVAQMEREAAAIFRSSGVTLEWLNCRNSPDDLEEAACRQELMSAGLIIRILPRPAFPGNFRGEPLGYSVGRSADVYVSTANQIVCGIPGTVLGTALAHELGHVLLGPKAHSGQGIMLAAWGRVELRLIARHLLCFTDSQGDKIRAAAAARARRPSPE